MSKKFHIVAITIILLAAAVIVFLFFYSRSKNEVQNTKTNQGQGNYALLPIEDIAKKDKLTLDTSKGEVNINNIYKNPVQDLSKNGVEFSDNDYYSMAFYPEDEGFLIVIKNSDVKSSLEKAEEEFLSKLGINQQQACQLKVSITVPISVNEKYSGGVYGFSFCTEVNHIE